MGLVLILGISTFARSPAQDAKPAADEPHVGFAEADITPALGAKPVYLAGFGQNRLATAVHDPIMARAVVLKSPATKLALVSVDLVGFFHPNVVNVRKQLPEFQYVLVSSTHNHEGPDTLGIWGPSAFKSGVDPDYLKLVERQIIKAIQEADRAAKPAAARIGKINAPELLHDGREPQVLHDELVVLQFVTRDVAEEDAGTRRRGDAAKDETPSSPRPRVPASPRPSTPRPLGLLVQWNCHPETLGSKNTLLSADYVGYAVEYLKKQQGCPVAYFTGTVGGLMTSLHVPIKDEKGVELKDGTYEKTERYGILLGKRADQALAAAHPIRLTPLEVKSKHVFVPMTNKLYLAARWMKVLDREAFLWTGDPYRAEPVSLEAKEQPMCIRTEVALLRMGDLQVACIPGEIYPELVLDKVQEPVDANADYPDAPVEPAIYKQLTSPHRMLIGLANDEIGYILPKRQWDEKAPFCYGRKRAQYGEVNSVGPDAGPVLCRVFKELAEGLAK